MSCEVRRVIKLFVVAYFVLFGVSYKNGQLNNIHGTKVYAEKTIDNL